MTRSRVSRSDVMIAEHPLPQSLVILPSTSEVKVLLTIIRSVRGVSTVFWTTLARDYPRDMTYTFDVFIHEIQFSF